MDSRFSRRHGRLTGQVENQRKKSAGRYVHEDIQSRMLPVPGDDAGNHDFRVLTVGSIVYSPWNTFEPADDRRKEKQLGVPHAAD